MNDDGGGPEASNSDPETNLSDTIGIGSIPDAVIIADADTRRIVRVNTAAADLFRCQRDDLVGRLQTELHPTGETDAYVEAFQRGLEGQRVNRLRSGDPLYVETADGQHVPVEINVQILTIGSNDYLMGIFRETSDQLARERALEQTTSRLEALLDALPVPVSLVDTDGVVRRWNRAAEETLGYAAEQVVGQQYSLFTDEEEFSSLLERVVDGERLRNYQTTLRAENGSLMPAELDVCPIYVDGTVSGIVGTAMNIADRHQREQQLDVLHRMTRHNVRNELTVIRGWSEMLRDGACEREKAAAKIMSASDRLLELSEEVVKIRRVVSEDQQEVAHREISDFVMALAERLQTNESVADFNFTSRSTAGQIRAKAAGATLELFDNLFTDSDSAATHLESNSLDSHIELFAMSDTPFLSRGERTLIQQGTETALRHAPGLKTARLYLTIQAVGGTVTLNKGPADVPATDLHIEIPRADT